MGLLRVAVSTPSLQAPPPTTEQLSAPEQVDPEPPRLARWWYNSRLINHCFQRRLINHHLPAPVRKGSWRMGTGAEKDRGSGSPIRMGVWSWDQEDGD